MRSRKKKEGRSSAAETSKVRKKGKKDEAAQRSVNAKMHAGMQECRNGCNKRREGSDEQRHSDELAATVTGS